MLRHLARAPRAAATRQGSWTSRPHKDGNYKMNGAKMMFVVRHAERHDRSTPDGWSELALRPQDTPLSQRGLRQSRRLGKWFYGKLPIHRPLAIFASPFIRRITYSANLRLFGHLLCVFGAVFAYSAEFSFIGRLNTLRLLKTGFAE